MTTTPADSSGDTCPDWCVSTDHLEFRLNHKMDDFYHRGPTIESPTADFTHNWDPIHIEAYLSQQMHFVGEFNYVPMRGQVVVAENYTLSPDNARQFAAVLVDLAAQADALASEPS